MKISIDLFIPVFVYILMVAPANQLVSRLTKIMLHLNTGREFEILINWQTIYTRQSHVN